MLAFRIDIKFLIIESQGWREEGMMAGAIYPKAAKILDVYRKGRGAGYSKGWIFLNSRAGAQNKISLLLSFVDNQRHRNTILSEKLESL